MDVTGQEWDLLVLGGGTAGLVGAKTAAGLGASALLVESGRLGGDCLWTGCVPSKALLAVAARAAEARAAAAWGVDVQVRGVDFAAVMRHVRGAVAAIEPTDSADALTAAGVTVVTGRAAFVDERTVAVDGRPIRFRQALLATGASPAIPPIVGLADAVAAGLALTSDTVWGLEALPARLAVLGGGSIGCELGQAFARLGAQVTVVEADARILPREDPDASTLVEQALRRDGVEVLVGSRVTEIREDPSRTGGELWLDDGRTVGFDRLLVAVGRSPRSTGLGLEAAGVEVDRRGFAVVDPRLRTTNPRIWAAGDVTAHPQFTHTAGMHASVAATNAVLGLRRAAPVRELPRVTFTQPEVAAVGVSPVDAVPGSGLRVVTRRHDEVDRAIAEAQPDGFATLVLDRRHRVVGASLVGPRAGESLAELVLAVRKGLTSSDLAGTVHAYPTYADAGWNAAIADVRSRLGSGATAVAIRLLLRARRWRDRVPGQRSSR